MLKQGVELVAKTYGIRKIVSNDDYIFPVAASILASPFVTLVILLIWDVAFKEKAPPVRTIVAGEGKKAVTKEEKQKQLKEKKE